MEACANGENVTGCSSSRQLFLDAATTSLYISGYDTKTHSIWLFVAFFLPNEMTKYWINETSTKKNEQTCDTTESFIPKVYKGWKDKEK